ncbi:MAG: AI-2E family transporter [Arthrobacter sp.]|nr:AI-2E family transporter [Arthrobacter sp.]
MRPRSSLAYRHNGERIRGLLIGYLPDARRGIAHAAAGASIAVLGRYVHRTLIIAAIEAVIVLAVLLILRFPLGAPLAAVVLLGGFVPIIGATAAGSLGVLVFLVEKAPYRRWR